MFPGPAASTISSENFASQSSISLPHKGQLPFIDHLPHAKHCLLSHALPCYPPSTDDETETSGG